MSASAVESHSCPVVALPCDDSCSDAIPPSAMSTRRTWKVVCILPWTWTTVRILACPGGPQPRVFPKNLTMHPLAQQRDNPCCNLQSQRNADVCIHTILGNYLAVPHRRCDDVISATTTRPPSLQPISASMDGFVHPRVSWELSLLCLVGL